VTRSIFITATDTDAGKTWLTSSLIHTLLEAGIHAKALKPVACGMNAEGRNSDIDALLNIQHLQDAKDINLYRFRQPAAPALAAAAEHRRIDPDQLIPWCKEKAATTDICLIEGVGGLMVPLTGNYLLCDWVEAMPESEIWLVIGCKLGAINHALLTLDKCKHMGRPPTRIILNAANPADNHRLKSTRDALTPFIAGDCQVHTLDHGSGIDISADQIMNP